MIRASSTVSPHDGLVAEYFQQSEGAWHSQRRYYTLKDGETQEVVSHLTVIFLPQGSPELIELAQMHELADVDSLTSGALTTWESNYIGPSPKRLSGSTLFGVVGDLLYRDRGFSTSKPVTARFQMRDSKTMCLKTEYSGSSFEEEIKLIGTNYRTRQTIISRLGEEQMIGQYLETRIK
jgi:CpeS-like protein